MHSVYRMDCLVVENVCHRQSQLNAKKFLDTGKWIHENEIEKKYLRTKLI